MPVKSSNSTVVSVDQRTDTSHVSSMTDNRGDFSLSELAHLHRLYSQMIRGGSAPERETARAKLEELLAKRRRTLADLDPALLAKMTKAFDAATTGATNRGPAGAADANAVSPVLNEAGEQMTALDAVFGLLDFYLDVKDHERIAIALWVLLSHIYDRFDIAPRLALTSPVRGCGKTVTLDLLSALVRGPRKADSITAAAIYHVVNADHPTMLLDEADNLDTATNKIMRAVLNAGHRKGGKRVIVIKGEPREFDLFSPMAFGLIGILQLPLMHRSVVIRMEQSSRTLQRLHIDRDRKRIDPIYRACWAWARTAAKKIDLDPSLPRCLRNRVADNWRPLLAVADLFGEEWSKRARDAAVIFAHSFADEDIAVLLLSDIRDVFDRLRIDRIASTQLVKELLEIEASGWSEYRGQRDDQQPRKLTPGEVAKLLRPFHIKPKLVWPKERTASDKSSKGYTRAVFENAWVRYCDDGGTPAQRNNILQLRSRKGGTQ